MVATARGRQRERVGTAALPQSAWIALLIGAFALYYVVPGVPLSLALLVLCAALCYVQLPLAVSLVPLAMPFFMLPKHLGHLEFSLGETAIVLCGAAFVIQRVLQPPAGGAGPADMLRRLVPTSPLERAIALFLLAATAATLLAHFRHVALRQYRLVILEPVAYYVLVLALLRDTRAMARALGALVASGLLVALLGLGQYLFRPGTLGGAYWTGAVRHPLHLITSIYGSSNNLGLWLDRAVPVAVVLGLVTLALARQHRRDTTPPAVSRPRSAFLPPARGLRAGAAPWVSVLLWFSILPMAAVLLMSNSRGGIITALAVSLVVAYLWYGRRERRLEWAGVAVVLLGAAAVLWKARHGLSTIARVHVWISGLHMIRDHPLLGVGPDNFLYYYVNPRAIDPHNPAASGCPTLPAALPGKHYMDMAYWQEPCLSHPHNVVLDAWLSTGVVGLIALVALIVLFGLLAWRNLRRMGLHFPRAMQVACVAIVLATLLHGMVDNSIFVPDIAVAFWLALALTVNLTMVQSHAGAAGANLT